ncbi:hypothetical protein B0H17DRAFT_385599 [Mycena rosella]|uniref:Xylanolytic transcriptional activator regulatory domain-containing protein n=1 Tax=Mycena rosella TaxID=1033263 RepID=A0AAD7CN55_MYCRO|nr:hypothetical protein B0H17DRAFT_385599 [Mycena rosella]
MRSFTLYEAQTLCLAVFLPSRLVGAGRMLVPRGAGVRYAQEVGVHRRNRYDDRLVDEQWKRVFWILIFIDTYSSTFWRATQSNLFDDYDVDYPAECDDEYWETSDPDMAFKQPPGRPSVISYTIAYLKLMEILGMAQKPFTMVRQKDKPREWLESTVINLDSTLNAWIDMIPNHLRWDPNMEDPILRRRARCSTLVTTTNYPSLAICASSARACSHVIDVASRRGFLFNPHILNAVFDSCLIILLNVWGGRQVGLVVDPQKCLRDVEMCLRIFRTYESRWQIAGRQHDIITELMRAANMEIEYSPNPLKRGLDHDLEPLTSDSSPGSASQLVTEDEALETGGQPFLGANASVFNMDPRLSLPMYTEDLGRLPVYEPINWGINWGKDSCDGLVLPEYLNNLAASESLFPDSTGPGTAMPSDLAAITNGVPAGYNWNDWGKYIMNVEELVQSLDNPGEGRV